jgi:hypothetical protein
MTTPKIEFTDYGFSTPHSEIEEILGLPPGGLVRRNLDMDLADDCRWLHEHGVDLSDEAAVRQEFAKNPKHEDYPRYVDALVRAVMGFRTSK